MEKIQSAIAKARAARSGQAVAGPASASGQTPAAAAVVRARPPQVELAWDALREFRPAPAQMTRSRIVAFEGGREAVSFDVMRTKLLQQMRANNWRRLAITSPTAACGKSMIALNLAFSLARQADLRTILAELDLRRPSLAKTLGLENGNNFAKVLEAGAAFEDHAVRYGHNLAFATCSQPVRNSAELLNSPGVATVMAGIELRFDPTVVIFDMPPMLVSDDAMAFMGQVDCVLLVAAAEFSTIKEIDTCERELATQTNVMGVILNKCRHMGQDYGYGYGY